MFFLSGGTGTPKLLRGIREIIDSKEINVVANTGDDIWITNTLVCPDIDTLLYMFSGLIDDNKWWGIKRDTFKTNEFLKNLGYNEYMKIGDKDRAIHLMRTSLLKEGYNLTEVTDCLSKKLDVKENIVPMTNDEVNTKIRISDGKELHFQEWWINNSEKEIKEVYFDGLNNSKPSKKFLNQLRNHEEIIIGPSNPVTSIYPIISLEGVREKLKEKEVVAISPFVSGDVISGPASRLMKIMGHEPTVDGLNRFYEGFIDKLVVDRREKNIPENAIKADIIMENKKEEINLAKFLIKKVI